ncbi:MAG: putative zinc finger/helix-turn-helix YgiT family protein [Bacteroidia bacterium]|jgi:putative zinc finger/helix-turn-helix YgiT family protein
MNSPITGKPMKIAYDTISLTFRKEEFKVVNQYYLCEDSGEQFVDTRLGDLNQQLLHNAYRAKHNLPFPEEIKAIREKYSLSAVKMSEILGFGVNSYRQYEAGEVPSLSNGRLIRLAENPNQFLNLVQMADGLEDSFRKKTIEKVTKIVREEDLNHHKSEIEDYILRDELPSELTGYRRPDLDKLTEMVVYFSDKLNPWKTPLNKLLFYADFLCFKNTGYSMSGARYRAIQMGPVINNFSGVFDHIARNDDVDVRVVYFNDSHHPGEQFSARGDRPFNEERFTEEEMAVLHKVVERFEGVGTQRIIETSHKERGWIENEAEGDWIDYRYAFDLSQI